MVKWSMSLNEFKHIYHNAANIIRAKYSGMKGLGKVLDSLESRLPYGPADPRIERSLFFEPRIDAQQLSVPLNTAELVAQQLQKFGLFRLWVRVSCPNTDSGEPGTVLETDRPEDFEQLANRSCNQCGGHHGFTWDECETIYAFNSLQDESEQKFDFNRLKSTVPSSFANGTLVERLDRMRCEAVARNEQPHGSILDQPTIIALALRANQSAQHVPSALAAWWNTWMGPLVLIGAYLLFIVPIVRWCGQWIAIIVSVVVLVGLFLVIRGQVQAKLAPTVIQRTALWGGLSLATYCVAAGSTGFHFKGGASEHDPWWSSVAFGELSEPLLYSGIAAFLLTLIFVFAFDFQRGWLARNHDIP